MSLRQQPVTLFIEAQRLFRAQKHGMDVVAQELLFRLSHTVTSFNKTALVKQDADACLQSTPNLAVTTLPASFYPVWEQWKLPRFTAKQRGAWLHCTGNTAPVWGNTPLIVTIHDLIFLETNYLLHGRGGTWYQRLGNAYRAWVVPRVVRRARHIITVSEFQRQNLLQRFNLPENKVSVVYNGADERFFTPVQPTERQQVLQQYGINDTPYLFFLSNTEPRKNTAGVFKAFVRFCRQYPQFPHRLVIKGITQSQIDQRLQQLGATDIANRIQRVGYIDAAHLPVLYQGAAALWFPSFAEGFGLPIVEAMAGGTPVITSRCSVMPEIGGEAALYIDPHQPDELAATTARLLQDAALQQHCRQAGIQQAARFTWQQSVHQLLQVYQQVLPQS